MNRRELLMAAVAIPGAGKANKVQAIYQLLRKLVLPSNATSGARIVIDGNSNAILIYNAANQLTEAISPVAGTDSAGNAYPAGYTAFNPAATPIGFTNIKDGILYEGFIPNAGTQPDFNHISFLAANSSTVSEYQSPWIAGTTPVIEFFTAGTGNAYGTTAPSWEMLAGGSINANVYGSIIGALVGGDFTNGIATWQQVGTTIPFHANWSAGNAFGGFGGGSGKFQVRKTNEDEGKISGVAVAAAGVTATIFTLPSGFFSTTSTTFTQAMRNRAGVFTPAPIAIDTSGNVMTLAPAGGDQYLFADSIYDLGNLP